MIGKDPFGYYVKIVMENFKNIIETCYGECTWKPDELMSAMTVSLDCQLT